VRGADITTRRIAIGVVLLFAVVTRVGWMLHIRDTDPAATTSRDTPSYVQPARALVEDGELTTRPGSGEPIYARTPGYPLVVAGVFAVDENETLFLFVQVLLSCATVLLAYVLAKRLWGATVGILAAALVALEPLQFAASGTLLTESLFSLLVLCVVAAGFRVFATGGRSVKWCVLLGLAVAAAALVRPTIYYLPLFVVLLLVVSAKGIGVRTTVAAIVAFAVPVVVLVGGWQVRNDHEVGSWHYSGIEGVNLYSYRGADALARHDGISLAAAREQLAGELADSPVATCTAHGCAPADPSRPGPFYDELASRGLDLVRSYPVETAEGALRGLTREVFGPGTETVARYLDIGASTPLKLLLLAGLLSFYVGLAYGLSLVIRRPRGLGLAHVFALGVVAYVLVVSAGPEAYARFRGPVMPVLALYAGLGFTTAIERLTTKKQVATS
jgi:4-amino-4-deoxy-L-arabinose transferase-like glycosyltransferase